MNHTYLPLSKYLPMSTYQHIPTYVNLPSSTYLHQHTYLPMSTYQHIPTYVYLPTYTNLCQPTIIYLPASSNPQISIYKRRRPGTWYQSCLKLPVLAVPDFLQKSCIILTPGLQLYHKQILYCRVCAKLSKVPMFGQVGSGNVKLGCLGRSGQVM